MFYSQFILAKKGPLGTIWIAAHLERKLRKNQVADTDIGVSVDSILFPDVPIALRLSSHLLLGVVRIYSRKVNYLFDDCSEALLKIKQAFRSTAVDLPPEESTAPYHSITLPETFDLDDFELPDNDIFQGSYVDHHVSSREQITLQDTMGGVVYSTSQFGLDERFGDGDTSGLDLDEELFLDKAAASGHDVDMLNSDANPRASEQPMTSLKQDDNHVEMIANSETVQADINVDQIEDVNGDADFMDYAQGPCTPGLMEEPNVSNVHENSACDDHLESEDHNFTNCSMKGKSSSDLDINHQDERTFDWHAEENGYHSVDRDIEKLETLGGSHSAVRIDQTSSLDNICTPSPINVHSDVPDKLQNLHNGTISNSEPECYSVDLPVEDTAEPSKFSKVAITLDMFTLASTNQAVPEEVLENNKASVETEACSNLEIGGNMGKSCPPSNGHASNAELLVSSDLENPESQSLLESKDFENLNSVGDKVGWANRCVLQRCNSNLDQSDPSNSRDINYDDPKQPSQADKLCSPITSGGEEAVHASASDMMLQCENTDGSPGFDLPAPEKLLSVPKGFANVSSNLLEECTPDKEFLVGIDGGGAESNIISGKKRSFTESTLTVQSLDSVESPGVGRSKRFAESIPDDDDLLSSILVGRKSSVLRVKPTPHPEITSMKHARSAPRTSSSKRKVLMDDPMVLHGDTIRQQLTTTEDIRRVRKRAPCTRLEISMIQKQVLEYEIFSESMFTGLSGELASLQNHTYDLSEIKITKTNVNQASFEAAPNQELNSQDEASNRLLEPANQWVVSDELSVTKRNGIVGIGDPAPNQELNQVSDELHATEVREKSSNDVTKPTSSQDKRLTETAEIEIDGGNMSVAVAACADTVGFGPPYPYNTVSGDACNIVTDGIVETSSLEKCSEEDVSQKTDVPPSPMVKILFDEINASHMEVKEGKEVDANEVAGESYNDIVTGKKRGRDEYLFEGAEGCISCDMGGDLETNVNVCTESREHSSCMLWSADRDEQIRKNKLDIMNGGDFLTATVAPNAKSLISIAEDGEGSTEVHANMGNVFLDAETIVQQRSYSQGIMDMEIGVTGQTHVVDHDDFEYSAVGHDTEFLNVDDDEVAEADDDFMPNAVETRFIDNSGWSSRTRAVAKYLQTLFDKEAERGRSVLPMDYMLAGKTRKEASRMFFETLVLKTKDFIHVEQANAFDNINLKPRTKLMKSDF